MSTSYTEKRYFTDKSVGGKKAILTKLQFAQFAYCVIEKKIIT